MRYRKSKEENVTEKLIELMITIAREEGDAKHGKSFADVNHGYGALAEEVDEVLFEIESIEQAEGAIRSYMRRNNADMLCEALPYIREKSIRAIQELTQVAAVCDKYIEHIEGRKSRCQDE